MDCGPFKLSQRPKSGTYHNLSCLYFIIDKVGTVPNVRFLSQTSDKSGADTGF